VGVAVGGVDEVGVGRRAAGDVGWNLVFFGFVEGNCAHPGEL
jgi:hypothetical protein